jgi:hypothetical protein
MKKRVERYQAATSLLNDLLPLPPVNIHEINPHLPTAQVSYDLELLFDAGRL